MKRLLEGAHHGKFRRPFVMFELAKARAADAVLSADRAPKIGDDVVHNTIDVAALRTVTRTVPVGRTHHVVVHVSVARMPEGTGADTWISLTEHRIGPAQELGDARDGYRDIVRDRAPSGNLCFDQALANFPQPGRLRSRSRDQRVAKETPIAGLGQRIAQGPEQ